MERGVFVMFKKRYEKFYECVKMHRTFLLLWIGFFICMSIILWGCTISVSMAHTEGQASDVIDETQAPANTVSPNLQIPLKGV